MSRLPKEDRPINPSAPVLLNPEINAKSGKKPSRGQQTADNPPVPNLACARSQNRMYTRIQPNPKQKQGLPKTRMKGKGQPSWESREEEGS